MHTAVSFTTLSARGTRFRMVPKAYIPGKDSRCAHSPRSPGGFALETLCFTSTEARKLPGPCFPPEHHPLPLRAPVWDGLTPCQTRELGLASLSAWGLAKAPPSRERCAEEEERLLCTAVCLPGPIQDLDQTPTFLWKVPSSAATITVFPALAMVSLNSTMSGNWKGWGRKE